MALFSLVIEGDSACDIWWVEGTSKGPWRIRPWLAKVREVSAMCNVSFSHVLRAADVGVDALAKGAAIQKDILA